MRANVSAEISCRLTVHEEYRDTYREIRVQRLIIIQIRLQLQRDPPTDLFPRIILHILSTPDRVERCFPPRFRCGWRCWIRGCRRGARCIGATWGGRECEGPEWRMMMRCVVANVWVFAQRGEKVEELTPSLSEQNEAFINVSTHRL